MKNGEVPVKILGMSNKGLSVKLPFLEVPVTMNYDFFSKRVAEGYFRLREEDIAKKVSMELLN